ncbi:MAG: YcbK family protein [Cardiobacteriaceae bacterium]|nr:YcbK family protein [Cardiobacteriaceae bacterium]
MTDDLMNRPITTADFEHSSECPCCRLASRRTFIKTAAIATAGLILPAEWAKAASSRERMIKMFNPHTGETLNTVYWSPDEGGYITSTIDQVSKFFRDFRQNSVKEVDWDLLNILNYIQTNVGFNRTINLNSGYRSPTTNRMLARRSKNVGKNSYHMKAMAADISVKGFNSRDLRNIAMRLNAGGVGVYRGSNFIHVDSGPRRQWFY